MQKPSLSVIIVSYNRKTFLEDTLRDCFQQTVKAQQVIVIDASDENLLLTQSFVDSLGSTLTYVKWPEIGNISRQRNEGLNRATGELILFLDDDVKFEADLFETVISRFVRFKADALSGLIQSSHRPVSKEVFVFKNDIFHYLGQPSFHQCDFVVETYLVSAACFAVRKEAIMSIGGFDEQLGGVFDDSEVGIRLAKQKFLVLHDNHIKVFHFAAKNSGSRSPLLGLDWKYSNISYIQLKHFYKGAEGLFYKKAIWQLLRPSRAWMKPWRQVEHLVSFKRGYKSALRRLADGPIYISKSNSKVNV